MLLNKIIGYAVIALLSLSFMTTDAQASSVRPVHILSLIHISEPTRRS